jgi:diguanylate cyclase (GGDEF)-like protein/PAS domain S-box-containing protein
MNAAQLPLFAVGGTPSSTVAARSHAVEPAMQAAPSHTMQDPAVQPGRARARILHGLDAASATQARSARNRSPLPGAAPLRAVVPEATAVQLRDIVDHLDAMIAYWTADRVCTFASASYRLWFGKACEQIVGRAMRDLPGPADLLDRRHVDAAFNGEKQVFEHRFVLPDGSSRDGLLTFTPHTMAGDVVGLFVHVADVTPLKRAQDDLRAAKERAEAQAAHDPLTGLPNRLLLPETLDRAIAASVRGRTSLALMSIDADRFKDVNDTFGHAAGDCLLVELAARLRRSLRACDTVFRVGGDEFVAVLPSIGSEDEAQALARRIVEAAREPWLLAAGSMTPTVSIGVALAPRQGALPATLLAAADKALYEAKRTGRDRLVVSR